MNVFKTDFAGVLKMSIKKFSIHRSFLVQGLLDITDLEWKSLKPLVQSRNQGIKLLIDSNVYAIFQIIKDILLSRLFTEVLEIKQNNWLFIPFNTL